MSVAAPSLTQALLAQAVRDAGLSLKPGQMLQAVVAAMTADGIATLQLGEAQVQAQLPQSFMPGTVLQLQVKVAGAAPQLNLVKAMPPEVISARDPGVQMQAASPEIVAAVMRVRAGQAAVAQVAEPESPVEPMVPATVIARPANSAITPTTSPRSDVAPAVPQAAEHVASVPTEASKAVASSPVALPQSGATQATADVPTLPQVATAYSSAAPAHVTAAEEQALPRANPPPVAASGTPPEAASVKNPSVPVPAPASVQSPVVPQPTVEASTPLPPTTSVRDTSPAALSPTPPQGQDAGGETPSGSPLLLAQQASRPVPNALQMVRMAPAVVSAEPLPTPAIAVATTPEMAVARAIPAALATQDSLGPLLQTLAAVARLPATSLPAPVMQLVRLILQQRIAVGETGMPAGAIERAVRESGVLLESKLAAGQPVGRDLKAMLLGLKSALAAFGGAVAPLAHEHQRTPPPLRDLAPRAVDSGAADLPDDLPGTVRQMAGQTDAALSRIKLAQIASLPDADAQQAAPGLRLELPLLAGTELVMAQLRIAPDGRGSRREQKRGWSVKFAMNFAKGGEVGAEVGILDRTIDVGLWALDAGLAAQMRALLPELSRAIAESGLRPGRLSVRGGAPAEEKRDRVHLVDAVS